MIVLVTAIVSTSVDCSAVINLAFGLNLNTVQPSYMTKIQLDCCDNGIDGVKCDPTSRVTQINWSRRGLNGSINATQLPSGLVNLDLSFNRISGGFPDLPSTLQTLNLQNNTITGSITTLPHGLVVLDLSGNLLTGNVPALPSTILYLYLGAPLYPGNKLSGSVVANKLLNLYLYDNWIRNVTIQDFSQLSHCDISLNPLLGNPNILNLTMCVQNGLYDAELLSDKSVKTKILSSENTIPTPVTTLYKDQENSILSGSIIPDVTFLIVGIAIFVFLVILLLISSKLIKAPKVKKSRFGRKNSFGTLNTVASTKTRLF